MRTDVMEGVCFLIGIPRSGTTLVQRLLATHPSIRTDGEPWVLMPLLGHGVAGPSWSRVDPNCQNLALRGFWQNHSNSPCTPPDVLAAYGKAAYAHVHRKDSIYVDKTPRYAIFLPQLLKAFPECKFILLHRNPLASLASALRTWHRGHWMPGEYHLDLEQGIPNILNAHESHANIISIGYEALVHDPQHHMDAVFKWLGQGLCKLPDRVPTVDGPLGDPGQASHLVVETVQNNWQRFYDTPVRQAWALQYIQRHQSGLERVGYDVQSWTRALKAGRPTRLGAAVDKVTASQSYGRLHHGIRGLRFGRSVRADVI